MIFFAREIAFADNKQTRPDPLETSIATELWRWAFLPPEERAEILSQPSRLAGALEWWLCGPMESIPFTRSRGIWCDGVIDIAIRRVSRNGFKIAGIGFFPTQLAPFEVEFHFARRRDLEPLRTIIRFGERDAAGEIRWGKNTAAAAMLFSNRRQKRDRDWCVAVELTRIDS